MTANTYHRKQLILLLSIPLLILACIVPGLMGAVPVNTNRPALQNRATLVGAAPNATPTPTPFQPIPPTPTYLPTIVPTLAPTPTPNGAQAGSNAPAPLLPVHTDQVNILLLGSDQRPYEGGFRTDTILLLSLNPNMGTASLVSFPRDLYLYLPGWSDQRINTAMSFGGIGLLNQTLSYNFGVKVDRYVLVNFWAFVQVIDSLGGIDVQVARALRDHRDGYGNYSVPAGLVHMDGDTALWYVRSRYTSSDFDRGRRQQEVLQAIFLRMLSLNALERAPELYNIYINNVTTDITLTDITPLLPLAGILKDVSKVQRYYIGPAQVIPWTTPSGSQVLLPRTDAIIALLRQALGPP
jgi:LCP family protein required for cell wall assembly